MWACQAWEREHNTNRKTPRFSRSRMPRSRVRSEKMRRENLFSILIGTPRNGGECKPVGNDITASFMSLTIREIRLYRPSLLIYRFCSRFRRINRVWKINIVLHLLQTYKLNIHFILFYFSNWLKLRWMCSSF